MKKHQTKPKKAFTLVELIIVITILTILATIAFVSFQDYTKSARDGNRISTLKNIEKWLSVYNIKTWNYPEPEEYVEILSWSIILSKQWIVWKTITKQINLNKETFDPKDNTNYIYSITWNSKKYQLATYLEENKLTSYIPEILKTYAENIDYTKRYFYTIWDKVWILLEEQTNTPITKTNYSTWLNLETNTNNYKVYFSNDTNSGSITSSWTTLITTIIEKQNTTQIEQTPPETPMYTCTGNLITTNADITNTTNLTSNTNYQTTDSNAKCYYTCKSTYSWPNCENREVYWDEDIEAITACNKWVELAIWTNAWWYQNWIWVPSNPAKNWNFTTDGTGTPLTDDFYKRTVTHNGINYTCKWFAVMKYEAKFNSTSWKTQPENSWKTWAVSDYATDNDTFPENLTNGIVSKATDHPIAYIRQWESIAACGWITYNLKTSHLITNNEWMAIARNVELNWQNWTNWIVWNWWIYRWNVNLNDNMSYSSYSKISKYTEPAWSDSDVRWTNVIWNRRLILSNNSNIWDLSWNVREHVNKSNIPTTSNLRSTNSWNNSTIRISNSCNWVNNWNSFYWNDWFAECTFTNSYTYPNIWPKTLNLNSSNWIWRIHSYNTTNNIFVRWGNGDHVAYTWLYTIILSWGSSTQNGYGGFRCSF